MSFSCPLVFPLFSFWFCSLRFVYIQKEVAKEGENGLMDLLRIKSTTKNEKREKKKTDIAAVVIDAVAVLFDTILARGSIGVDGNQKAKKKKKSTACDVVSHPSISILYFFPPLFVYFISYCCC